MTFDLAIKNCNNFVYLIRDNAQLRISHKINALRYLRQQTDTALADLERLAGGQAPGNSDSTKNPPELE